MSLFDNLRDAVIGGGMVLVGKVLGKIALALGGSFVVSQYVLTPVYNSIMAALASAGSGGDLAPWLALTRIPDAISVIFAAYGVRSAQRLVFRRLTSGSA